MQDYGTGQTEQALQEDMPRKLGSGFGGDLFESIDLSAIWAAVFRSRFAIIIICVACLALGILITLLTTPIYQAKATVQIDQETARVIGTEEVDSPTSAQDSDRFLKTQMDILRSTSLAIAVAEDNELFGNPEFMEKMNEDPVDEAEPGLTLEETERNQVLEILLDNIDVSMPIDSRIATISFKSPDADLATVLTNSFMDNYIRSNLQRKFDNSAYAREFLKEQLDEAAARLEESERDALAYARRARIIDVSNAARLDSSNSAPRSLTAATLVQLNEEYAAAYARRIEEQKKWENIRNASLMSIPDVLNNQAIQNLLEQKAGLEASLQEQLERRKEDYPSVRQLTARLDEINNQIDAIASNIRVSQKGKYETALSQQSALEARIAGLKSETLDEQEQAVQFGILRRETETNRELYDLLLTRFNELNAEAGVQSNNVTVVDRALRPVEPVEPNVPINLALSVLAGLVLSGAFVFGREQIFDTLRTPDDLTKRLGITPIGVIPLVKEEYETFADAVADGKSGPAEAYNTLRTSLMLSSSRGLPSSLMFTSSQQSEGKSSTCFAVSLALARAGRRVIIVDLDLRRPHQHTFFSVPNESGMSDLLTSNASLSDAICSTPYDNVDFIPAGSIPPNPTELLSGSALPTLIKELEKQYDVVMVDSPPVLGLADALIVSSVVKRCVFIIESNRNQAKPVHDTMVRLEEAGGQISGLVLTKFDSRQGSGSYDYSYQYHYKDDAKKK